MTRHRILLLVVVWMALAAAPVAAAPSALPAAQPILPQAAAPSAGDTTNRGGSSESALHVAPLAYTSPASFSQGFDNVAALTGQGWYMQNNSSPNGSTGWFQGNFVFPAQAGGATSYIGANFNNTTGANTISNWLLTPELQLSSGDTFSFWTRTVDSPVFPDRLQVRLSTNGASTIVGTAATDVGDFTTLLLDINQTLATTGYPNVWTQYTITLSSIPINATGRFAFRYFVTNGGPDGANSDYIGIDTLEFSGTPLAVTLAGFDAAAQGDQVLVSWETVSEIDNAGFTLYRGLQADGSDRALLTYVPSQAPGGTQGAAYTFEDADVQAGQTYWYWLEDVSLSGATTLHGPVSATVQAPTAVTLAQLDASSGLASPAGWLLALLAGLLAMAAAGWLARRVMKP